MAWVTSEESFQLSHTMIPSLPRHSLCPGTGCLASLRPPSFLNQVPPHLPGSSHLCALARAFILLTGSVKVLPDQMPHSGCGPRMTMSIHSAVPDAFFHVSSDNPRGNLEKVLPIAPALQMGTCKAQRGGLFKLGEASAKGF